MTDKFSKKIKFALKMQPQNTGRDKEVRTLEELRQNFDLESILNFFLDGKLREWLEDRYYIVKADKISILGKREELEDELQKDLKKWHEWHEGNETNDLRKLESKISKIIKKYDDIKLQENWKELLRDNPEETIHNIRGQLLDYFISDMESKISEIIKKCDDIRLQENWKELLRDNPEETIRDIRLQLLNYGGLWNCLKYWTEEERQNKDNVNLFAQFARQYISRWREWYKKKCETEKKECRDEVNVLISDVEKRFSIAVEDAYSPEQLVREIIIDKIYDILEVEMPSDLKIEKYDLFKRQEYVEREDVLVEVTDDKEAIAHCMDAATDPDELNDLIAQGKTTIYLVNGDEKIGYEIDATWENKTFIGADNPTIRIINKKEEETKEKAPCILMEKYYKDELKKRNIELNKLRLQVRKQGSYFKPWYPIESEEELNQLCRIVDYRKVQGTSNIMNANSAEAVKERLVRYMDSCFPLIYFNTYEEDKADEIISSLADNRRILEWNAEGFFEQKDGKSTGKKWFDWSLPYALRFLIREYQLSHGEEAERPKKQLLLNRSILVLKDIKLRDDINRLPEDDAIVAWLKYLAQLIYNGELEDCNIVIISPIINIPRELEHYMTVVRMDYLSDAEIEALILRFCEEQGVKKPDEENSSLMEDLVDALKGLSEFDILNILALAIADDKEINQADLEMIQKQKRNTIMKSNLLEAVSVKEDENDIGGLENLKKWLERKAMIFEKWREARKFCVDMPKGVLMAGMPGCGKSLSAKVTAVLFDAPLFRMDMGRLMGKYVGESEANMRRALRLVDAMSPCVFWIDEMEKAFAGANSGEGSGEITTRLLGTFLTWMQEKTSRVFVVATANKIQDLPSELLRKGRFDEVFYIGMPNEKEREQIFRIHLEKRKACLDDMDIKKLSKKTKGYSGADIEGVVRESIEMAFVKREPLTVEDVDNAIKKTHPLTEIMRDSIAKLTLFYRRNKFKSANSDDASIFNIKSILPESNQ